RPTGIWWDGGRVYQCVCDQSRIVALDGRTGKRLWSYQAKGWIYGAAAIAGERLFIGSQDFTMACLNKRTGEKLWQFPTKSRIEAAAGVDDQSVLFGSCDGGYYRIAQADGKLLWKFETQPD